MTLVIQVFQATEIGVVKSPQRTSRAAVALDERPEANQQEGQDRKVAGSPISTAVRFRRRTKPTIDSPARPPAPTPRRTIDSAFTERPVTFSRKGRR